MKTATIFIRSDEMSCVGDMPPVLLGLGNHRKVRASTVVPTNRVTRAIFFWLRAKLGEQIGGWISRRLPGPWAATIIETGAHYVSNSRARAIKWEIEELHRLMERN